MDFGATQAVHPGWFWLAGAAAVLVLWMLGAHNRLTALRGRILAAWAPLEAELQQRWDTCDRLAAAVAGPLAGERAALEAHAQAIARARAAFEPLRKRPLGAAGQMGELARADATLKVAGQRLRALVELDPALRFDAGISPLLADLLTGETRLQFLRQAFNDAVQAYNAALAQFPTRLLAPVYRFLPAEPL